MNWLSRSDLIYLLAGVVVTAIVGAADGQRGLIGSAAAWMLVGVPIIVSRVADVVGVRKTNINRGLIAFPSGMLIRLVWTLGGAAAIYHRAGERVGLGFWMAVLVFYQIALFIQTRHWLNRKRF